MVGDVYRGAGLVEAAQSWLVVPQAPLGQRADASAQSHREMFVVRVLRLPRAAHRPFLPTVERVAMLSVGPAVT